MIFVAFSSPIYSFCSSYKRISWLHLNTLRVLPYDNHAITAVYSHKLAKWLALDSARNCYFLNDLGEMLSVSEIRQCLVRNEKIHFEYLHRFSKIASNAGVEYKI